MATITKETIQKYENIIADLEQKYDEAKKEQITAEANYKMYTERKRELEEQLEQLTGVPIDEVSELIEQKTQQLDDIMNALLEVDYSDPMSITEEDLDKLNDIINNFNISEVDEDDDDGSESE